MIPITLHASNIILVSLSTIFACVMIHYKIFVGTATLYSSHVLLSERIFFNVYSYIFSKEDAMMNFAWDALVNGSLYSFLV